MTRRLILAAFVLALAYLLFWPVPVTPVAWDAPKNAGFQGAFARNERLKDLEQLPIGANHGPETIAVDASGRLYTATAGGTIVRLRADGSSPQNWVSTGGRPLGLSFDAGGTLFVADAFRGLLAISPGGAVRVLATEADGVPIRYANSVDVASDGKVYFSDASTKFGAKEWAGTYSASLLDILEHGGHGRLLVYDPASRRATTLIRGLNFANGVALAPDESFVLVAETGSYRVMRHWLAGPNRGRTEPLVENLPGFPDNVTTGRNGRFWVALVSPRNALVDSLSGAPFVRKIIQRLPEFIRPEAVAYGHVVAFDATGNVLASLQDPAGTYRLITCATETDDYLFLGSLEMGTVGRVTRPGSSVPRVLGSSVPSTRGPEDPRARGPEGPTEEPLKRGRVLRRARFLGSFTAPASSAPADPAASSPSSSRVPARDAYRSRTAPDAPSCAVSPGAARWRTASAPRCRRGFARTSRCAGRTARRLRARPPADHRRPRSP